MMPGVRPLFFCLATGGAMGALFLVCRAVCVLLGAGKLFSAVLDFFCCCLCAGGVFLCALALDHGRLRLFQVVFQLVGGWAVWQALEPLTGGAARGIRRIFRRIGGRFFSNLGLRKGKPLKTQEKTEKKLKKAQKKT